jgi:hypothetical protein
MHRQYQHGVIDLIYFGTVPSLERAQVERHVLHKLVDEMDAARKDYDACNDAHTKLVDEANAICKQIEEDEAPMGGFMGGLLGGASAYLLGGMGKLAEAAAAKKTEPEAP